MFVAAIKAHVGASLAKGIGASGVHTPVAIFMRLTLLTRVPFDTPPNTYKSVAVWANPYRTSVIGYAVPAVHGPGVPPGTQVGDVDGVGVGVLVGVGTGEGVPQPPAPVLVIVSTRHPLCATEVSEHILQRSLVFRPAPAAGRVTVVVW